MRGERTLVVLRVFQIILTSDSDSMKAPALELLYLEKILEVCKSIKKKKKSYKYAKG